MVRQTPRPAASGWRAPQRWIAIGGAAIVLGVAVFTGPRLVERPTPAASPAAAGRATTLGSPTPVPEPSFADPSKVGRWSPARYAQDWPGGLRSEAAGQPVLIDLVRGEDAHWDPSEGRWEGTEHVDPIGDGVPTAPWLDIVNVRVGWGAVAAFRVEIAADMPLPLASPQERWMAYGIVLDTDHDGRADVRFGVDNMPSGEHRTWRTDYRLGQTAWKAGPPYGYLDQGPNSGTSNDTWYPGEGEADVNRAYFRYYLKADERDAHFYGWSSMIEDGRVVGTDYAPDAGWLVFDDGDLPLLGNRWLVDSVTSAEGKATVQDWFSITATFGADGELAIDACAPIHAFADVDATSIRLRNLSLGPMGACPDGAGPIDRVIRAVVVAPIIEYEIDRGVLILRSGESSIRLVGTTEEF